MRSHSNSSLHRGILVASVIASCVGSFVAYVKGKVVPAQAIKAQREKRGTNPLVLNLGEWSTSRIHRFTPGFHWIRCRVRSRVFPGGLEQKKNFLLLPRFNPGSSSS
jgi:hypothetical protein